MHSVSNAKKSRRDVKKTTKRRESSDHRSEITIADIEQTASETDTGDEEEREKICCWHECHKNLTDQQYVLRDDHPYCIECYENMFADTCEECNKIIGIDSKNVSHNGKHWHKACFLCNKCQISLVDVQFGSKGEKTYCGNCYDAQFASTCDRCNEIIRFGTKKMEYKTRQWHENCFTCGECKTFIGKSKFIPKDQELYCSSCYEDKIATKCTKCNSVITAYGITYKNQPWHRRCFTCTECKAFLSGHQFTSRDDKPYCAECYGKFLAESDIVIKPKTVGVFMKKELPEKQVKNFLEQVFRGEMRLNKKVEISKNGSQRNTSR